MNKYVQLAVTLVLIALLFLGVIVVAFKFFKSPSTPSALVLFIRPMFISNG